MEAHVNIAARSLLVPCVQDVLKENPTTVPERYVRNEQDPPMIMEACSRLQVPVIDLGRLVSEDSAKIELEKLHEACRDWGFFQLINHEVSPRLIERVKKGTKELFNMPMEEKKKFWRREGESDGLGPFVLSEDQKLDWADIFNIFTLPASVRNPHLFPKLPLPFRDDLDAYSKETQNLAKKLLYLMAKALGMDAKDLEGIFDYGLQGMRMNYYPPCPQPELVIGLNSHSDGDAITILLQVNEVEGLQIRKDGKWVPVTPLLGAFIINVGDIVEIMTNGIYQSIEHRATVNTVKERISIATFFSPRIEAEIGPAPSLVTSETPAIFRRITVAEHLKGYLARELKGKSYLDAMRIHHNEAQKS